MATKHNPRITPNTLYTRTNAGALTNIRRIAKVSMATEAPAAMLYAIVMSALVVRAYNVMPAKLVLVSRNTWNTL